MKAIKLTIAALVLSAASAVAQTNWNVDPSHSKLGFSITHMMVAETEGKFNTYEAKVSSKTETDFTGGSIEFTIDINSVDTDNEKRDGHLKSADFFDAEKFPKATFKSTSIKKVKGNTYQVTGDVTIKGVTKTVTLTANHYGKSVKDPYGMTRTGFKIMGKINRKDFGITWNAPLEGGGTALSDNVNIMINMELTKA